MRLISFDVGIKNMAYCIFDIDTNKKFSMIDWNIMNLMNESTTIIHTCSCHLKPTSKKNSGSPSPCKSKAKYMKNGKYYCDKHAKTCEFLPYSKECSQPSLKKMKIEALIQKYKECFPLLPMTKTSLATKSPPKLVVGGYEERKGFTGTTRVETPMGSLSGGAVKPQSSVDVDELRQGISEGNSRLTPKVSDSSKSMDDSTPYMIYV